MRHVFIINPTAGKRDKTDYFTGEIRAAFAEREEPYEIYVSAYKGDCTRIAREAAEVGDEVRLYACGGDGTLNEVVCGAVGHPNAAVTHYPGGTGNDFIKSFSEQSAFFSLPRLLDAEVAELDLIRCGERFAVNICSMGFDARIGGDVGKYKRLPLVTGAGAYIISAVVNTIKGVHHTYRIEVDGQTFDGRFSLICVGNGRHYGGSFFPLPNADLTDGLLDVLIVKGVSRLTVFRLIGSYAKGRYAEMPQYVTFLRGKKVQICCEEEEPVNVDGELLMRSDITMETAEEKIRFFFPKGLTFEPGH